MNIPDLKPSKRSREYNLYSDVQRACVVYGWLFDGKTHRELDEEVLGLDRDYSKGYQSMGILHYLGLKKDFHGLFRNVPYTTAINALQDVRQDFRKIIHYLEITRSRNVTNYAKAQEGITKLKEAVYGYLAEKGVAGAANSDIGRALGIYMGHVRHEGHISRTILGMMEAEEVVYQDSETKKWFLKDAV